jgi:hypothetical protein
MAKEKLTLSELKVQSFVTSLEHDQLNQVKGGYMIIKGRRYTYRSRWTFIDTRSDVNDMGNPPVNMGDYGG